MNTALVLPDNGEAHVVGRFTRHQVDLIKRTYAAGTSDDEFALFMEVCATTGLSPLARQIYAVMRWNRDAGRDAMSIQVSIDGFRLVAQRSREYRGQVGPWWCGADAQWRDVWLSDEYPAAARVGVLRTGFKEPLYAVARWKSYVQLDRAKQPVRMWAQMPDVMLAKCAESLALRKAFPAELSGLYTTEELGQSDAPMVSVVDAEPAPVVQPAQRPRSREVPAGKRWSEADLAYFWGNLAALEPKVTSDELHAILGVDSLHDWPDLDTALGAVFEARQNPTHSMSTEPPIPPSEDPDPEAEVWLAGQHPVGSVEHEWARYTALDARAAAWNREFPEQPIRYADPPRDAPAPQVRAYADGLERRLAKLGVEG
jgi:phage recombination protein Bet